MVAARSIDSLPASSLYLASSYSSVRRTSGAGAAGPEAPAGPGTGPAGLRRSSTLAMWRALVRVSIVVCPNSEHTLFDANLAPGCVHQCTSDSGFQNLGALQQCSCSLARVFGACAMQTPHHPLSLHKSRVPWPPRGLLHGGLLPLSPPPEPLGDASQNPEVWCCAPTETMVQSRGHSCIYKISTLVGIPQRVPARMEHCQRQQRQHCADVGAS